MKQSSASPSAAGQQQEKATVSRSDQWKIRVCLHMEEAERTRVLLVELDEDRGGTCDDLSTPATVAVSPGPSNPRCGPFACLSAHLVKRQLVERDDTLGGAHDRRERQEQSRAKCHVRDRRLPRCFLVNTVPSEASRASGGVASRPPVRMSRQPVTLARPATQTSIQILIGILAIPSCRYDANGQVATTPRKSRLRGESWQRGR